MGRNDDADEFLEGLSRHENENPEERAGRHYAEARSRYATVEAVTQLAGAVAAIAKTQNDTTNLIASLTKSIETVAADTNEMKGWLKDSYGPDGTRTPGVLSHIATFRSAWRWAIALLSAIAVAACSNAAHTWFFPGVHR